MNGNRMTAVMLTGVGSVLKMVIMLVILLTVSSIRDVCNTVAVGNEDNVGNIVAVSDEHTVGNTVTTSNEYNVGIAVIVSIEELVTLTL